MKVNTIISGAIGYVSPICISTDIESEGVLCSSMEGLGEEIDYEWAAN